MFLAFANAFDFKGRAGRAEYWLFALFVVVLQLVLTTMVAMTNLGRAAGSGVPAEPVAAILSLAASLFLFVPALSVTLRRLHDSDRSGWWILLSLPLIAVNISHPAGNSSLAFVGFAVLCAAVEFVFLVVPGTEGRNRFDRADRDIKRVHLSGADDNAPRRLAFELSAEAADILWPSARISNNAPRVFGKKR